MTFPFVHLVECGGSPNVIPRLLELNHNSRGFPLFDLTSQQRSLSHSGSVQKWTHSFHVLNTAIAPPNLQIFPCTKDPSLSADWYACQ